MDDKDADVRRPVPEAVDPRSFACIACGFLFLQNSFPSKTAGGVTTLNGQPVSIAPGTMGVCCRCGEIHAFEADMKARRVDAAELSLREPTPGAAAKLLKLSGLLRSRYLREKSRDSKRELESDPEEAPEEELIGISFTHRY